MQSQVLENEMLSFFEISALFFISGYIQKTDKDYRIANYSYDMLLNKKSFIISSMKYSLILFYSMTARNLGYIKEYEKSLNIANEGIRIAKRYGILNSLDNLLFYKALGEKNLNQINLYKITLTRLFSLLKAENDNEKSEVFNKYIYKNFGIREHELIEYK